MNPTLAKAAANLKRRARPYAGRKHLPAVWLMSDEKRLPDPEGALARLPRGAGFILRHYGVPQRTALALRLAAACRQRRITYLVAGDWRLAVRVGAAGLHLSEHLARRGPTPGARLWLGRRRSRGARPLLTVAAHDAAGLQRATQLNAAAVLLSPLFATPSHPERMPLGVMRAAELIRKLSVPVLALGGVTANTIKRLRQRHYAGVAGIGFIAS